MEIKNTSKRPLKNGGNSINGTRGMVVRIEGIPPLVRIYEGDTMHLVDSETENFN